MRLRVSSYAVICDSEHRFLLAHWNVPGQGSGWTLPGGGLDPGEHPEQAAAREVREETGYDVEIGALLGINNFLITADDQPESNENSPGRQILQIIYRANVIGGNLRTEEDGSTDDAGWFTSEELASLPQLPLIAVGRQLAGL